MMSANMAIRKQDKNAATLPFDSLLAATSLTLLVIGLIMVASATTEISQRIYDNPLHLLTRHVVYVGISLLVAIAALAVPIRSWQKMDWLLLALSFTLLVIVLIPGVGREVNGSTRWISLGFFSIQGSEFVKFFIIVYMAGYLVRREHELIEEWKGFIKPLILVSLLVLLLLQQPDFGAVVVIVASVMGLMYLAGVPLAKYLGVLILSLLSVALIAVWQPYRLARFSSFTDPWENPFGGGYQLTQALIAFGRGEWFGLGLGNSIQKLFFLPEAHTDFVFSVIAEEFGAVGAILIILLFACLVWKGLLIGKRAQTTGNIFPAYLAFGITLSLATQIIINLGVNLGLLPTKGLTLPLVSYGGNSLIVSCLLIAVLLRIDYEQNLIEAGIDTGTQTAAGASSLQGARTLNQKARAARNRTGNKPEARN
jgi:cell division protein FtsW